MKEASKMHDSDEKKNQYNTTSALIRKTIRYKPSGIEKKRFCGTTGAGDEAVG
jgi:hypothetical protein